MTSIFEKILYGLKVANDNIVAMNEKVDMLMRSLMCEDAEPNVVPGAETFDNMEQHNY